MATQKQLETKLAKLTEQQKKARQSVVDTTQKLKQVRTELREAKKSAK